MPEDGRRDHLALFVVTAGAGIRERSEEWKQAGEFFKAHAIQALAIETAEGAPNGCTAASARIGASPIRPRSPCTTASPRSIAASATASAIPRAPTWTISRASLQLLRPEEIGVQLTEGMMMEPEASVSALVFHHPDCAYFTADEAGATDSGGLSAGPE